MVKQCRHWYGEGLGCPLGGCPLGGCPLGGCPSGFLEAGVPAHLLHIDTSTNNTSRPPMPMQTLAYIGRSEIEVGVWEGAEPGALVAAAR